MSKELLGAFVKVKNNGYGRQEQFGICSDKRAFTGQDLYYIQTAGIENIYARAEEIEILFSREDVIKILQDANDYYSMLETGNRINENNIKK